MARPASGLRYPSIVLLPIGTDRPLRRPTLVTFALIAVNVAVHLASMAAYRDEESLYIFWQRWGVTSGVGLSDSYRYFTYAFLHADVFHILGNMLFLWVFGPNVEDRFGRAGFLLFYLGGAVIAGLAQSMQAAPPPIVPPELLNNQLLDPELRESLRQQVQIYDSVVRNIPTIGASGAVAAVTGAYLILFPRTLIRIILFFVLVGSFQIPAVWFIAFAIFRDMIGLGMGEGDVAYLAHLGGYAYGIVISLFLLTTRILKREDYDVFYMIQQARRRRQIREAAFEVRRERERKESVSAEQQAQLAALADKRASLTSAITAQRWLDAIPLYESLLAAARSSSSLAVLNRRAQLDLANHCAHDSRHQLAARAYEGFLSLYPLDPEAPGVRVMLALVLGRHLSRRAEALRLLDEASPKLDPDHLDMANYLRAEFTSPA